jgi:hypothetical protein
MATFAEIEAQYKRLQIELKQGALTREQYVQQVAQLMCQDETGRWWTIHPESGLWHYRWKDEWRPGVPPGHTPAALEEFLSLFPASQIDQDASPARGARPDTPKAPGRWLIPVLASLILVVVVAALVYWSIFADTDGEATREEQEESVSVLIATFTPGGPATFTPEARLSDTAEPPSLTATPIVAALPQGLDASAARPDWPQGVRDDFDQFDSGWSRGIGEGVTVDYREGQLRLELQGPERVAWSRFEPISFVDAWVEVTVDGLTWAAPEGPAPAAGIALHVAEDYYGYVFRIDGAGRYAIGRTLLDELPPVVDWTFSEHIRTEGSPNRLAVLAEGPRYLFFVNGWTVGPEGGVEDHAFSEGLLALWGSSGGAEAAQVTFDDALLLIGP